MCEYEVGRTGLEPVTSALSKQRSEPTELTVREGKNKVRGGFTEYFIQAVRSHP